MRRRWRHIGKRRSNGSRVGTSLSSLAGALARFIQIARNGNGVQGC
jgi:hypothetical protein